ncbi:MAG: hypothetical protein RLZZ401_1965 [Pseudomonadota bacterium]|jgi:uncharacterized protein (DUF697 family)
MASSESRLSARQLAGDDPVLLAAVRRSARLLNRRALVAAAASAVPVPGLDWAVEAALLSRLIPAINAEFGLNPDQLARLPEHQREQVYKAIATVGSMLVGRLVTKELILSAAQHIGVRLSVKQASKYVPVAGQAVSALIGYLAIRYLGHAHMKDCVRVAKMIAQPTSDPAALAALAP